MAFTSKVVGTHRVGPTQGSHTYHHSPLRIQRNGDACGSAATRAASLAERYWHRRIRAQSVTGTPASTAGPGGRPLPLLGRCSGTARCRDGTCGAPQELVDRRGWNGTVVACRSTGPTPRLHPAPLVRLSGARGRAQSASMKALDS